MKALSRLTFLVWLFVRCKDLILEITTWITAMLEADKLMIIFSLNLDKQLFRSLSRTVLDGVGARSMIPFIFRQTQLSFIAVRVPQFSPPKSTIDYASHLNRLWGV